MSLLPGLARRGDLPPTVRGRSLPVHDIPDDHMRDDGVPAHDIQQETSRP